MTHGPSILQVLDAAAPSSLSTSELCARTGIASRSSVYHATRELMLQGLVRGERAGHSWRFYATRVEQREAAAANPEPVGGFIALPDYGREQMRSDAGWQALYLSPLLTFPQERTWLMHKLASPCTRLECENAVVLQYVQPLRDLLYADARQARGEHNREDAFIRYYNGLLGLPEDFGIEHTWRSGSEARLRLPGESGRAGWPARHLQATVSSRKLLRKAEGVVDLVKQDIDLVVYTPRHILLVQVYQPGAKVALKTFERLRHYAAVLERRLQRGVGFGFIVERVEFLPTGDLLHISWEDIYTRMNAHNAAPYMPNEEK
ncbi:MAG: helix-turn-helix domain-containing protein [Chloroflexi bacterium]|nr:helix-turn-helix domain-containing protein [Chloroflexota bacterium]